MRNDRSGVEYDQTRHEMKRDLLYVDPGLAVKRQLAADRNVGKCCQNVARPETRPGGPLEVSSTEYKPEFHAGLFCQDTNSDV